MDSEPLLLRGTIVRHGEQWAKFQVGDMTLVIEQQEERVRRGDENTLYTIVWESAYFLHAYLASTRQCQLGSVVGKRVLELGSGTGAVGLMFAALGAEVTLTDLPQALELIHRNVVLNFGEEQSWRMPRVVALKWGEPLSQELGSFDILVCSDLLFYRPLFTPLLSTVLEVVESGAKCLISQIDRGWQSEFYQMLKDSGLTVEPVTDFDFRSYVGTDAVPGGVTDECELMLVSKK
eukprot:TRINITY_DN40919_c0_g1_i1.p1 TRINITY_DN40919_c0_g1~~TRINITY_DN40919_c0_g1_i1.p1  ORF type:complete len:235 (-),score=24.76 TRINITY_DN40919_c0_g1_i1:314-1018(-)